MAYFLFQGNYSADSVKGMVGNPEDREAAARKLIEGLGGKLHSFYFSFGDYDFAAIIEGDKITMAAGSLIVGASGAIRGGKTTALLTGSEGVEAMRKAQAAAASYAGPG